MIKQLDVYYHERKVGTLALTTKKSIAFQYSEEWLEKGFSISPFSLPLRNEVYVPTKSTFDGLFGVFADSLPDAWGQLLLERYWVKSGHSIEELGILEKLAMIGNNGMGALCYRPAIDSQSEVSLQDIDRLYLESSKLLSREEITNLDTLYKLGGSSGGTRPKVMGIYQGKPVIIKFPAKVDREDIGVMEYQYSMCARKCGIRMSETFIVESTLTSGYFGTMRFDRSEDGGTSFHVISAAALLEADFEQPSLDYSVLFKLTKILTRDNKDDLENLYLRLCFNVLAHNQDDHAKNFSYIFDDSTNTYRLSPAFDLTYSSIYYREHTTSVNGNGLPSFDDLVSVGEAAGLTHSKCVALYQQVKTCVDSDLSEYLKG